MLKCKKCELEKLESEFYLVNKNIDNKRRQPCKLCYDEKNYKGGKRKRSLKEKLPYPHSSLPDVTCIPLTKGKITFVDKKYEYLGMENAWTARTEEKSKTVYAYGKYKKEQIFLHRVIFELEFRKLEEGEQIDHINGDGSDNRCSNLRAATSRQNCFNRPLRSDNVSGHKGVRREKSGKWVATIFLNNKNTILGRFKTKEEAISVYRKAEKEIAGEFAFCNRPAISGNS